MRWFIFTLLIIGFAESDSQAEPALKKEVELLQGAFDRRFNFDLVQVVELYAHSEMGELRRTLQMATKRIGGSLHGLAHFMAPAELRGTRLLMIERLDRNDDFFIYVPTLKKKRRVSSAQRADVFMGTDLTYEDFERRYVEDYDVSLAGSTIIQDEDVYAIRCAPRYESGHEYAVYYVAKSDQAILEVRYFRAKRDEPVKVQRISREKMMIRDGYIVPTEFWVENMLRGTKTEVRFSEIRINPVLGDRLFSTSALEVGRRIPYLER
jgi:outer membrane lipoprotein-sorting protein